MVVKKNKFSRRFDEDIWGNILTKARGKVYKYILEGKRNNNFYRGYRVDIGKPKRRKKHLSAFGKILMWRRKLSLFYGGIKRFQFKNIEKTICKSSSNFNNLMGGYLERTLSAVVYRMNFGMSVEESINFIRLGYIMVNKEIILYPNKVIKVGDIVEVVDFKKKFVYNKLLVYLRANNYFFKLPKYIGVNYNLLLGVVLLEPDFLEIPYPFKVRPRVFSVDFFGKTK
jgi:ribosomal protein S4